MPRLPRATPRPPHVCQTPLHLAVAEGHLEALRFLLDWRGQCGGAEVKADVEARNMFGETPVHVAAKSSNVDAIGLLLRSGARADVAATNGMTPVHLAVWAAVQSTSSNTGSDTGSNFNCSIAAHPPSKPLATAKLAPEAIPGPAKGALPPTTLPLLPSSALPPAPLPSTAFPERLLFGLPHLPAPHTIGGGSRECGGGVVAAVAVLLEANADPCAVDKDGNTPMALLPSRATRCSVCQEVQTLLQRHISRRTRLQAELAVHGAKLVMDQLEKELSSLVGLHSLKQQLRTWGKGLLLDQRRRALGLPVPPRRAPHMAFLGSPGTGKTTVARVLARMLALVGVLPLNKVIEVQRTDLVGEYVGHTGPKTRRKIEEAEGGILFVDEAYRLMPCQRSEEKDYGIEALEEIMTVMDSGKLVVIFAGYAEPMQRVFEANEGFKRRVTKCFTFDDLSPREIARVMLLKMGYGQTGEQRRLGGAEKPSCENSRPEEETRIQQKGGVSGGQREQTYLRGEMQWGSSKTGERVEERRKEEMEPQGKQRDAGADERKGGGQGEECSSLGGRGTACDCNERCGNRSSCAASDGSIRNDSDGPAGGGGSMPCVADGSIKQQLQGEEVGKWPVGVEAGGRGGDFADGSSGIITNESGSGSGNGSGGSKEEIEAADDTDMSPLTGFRLHSSCSEEALAEAIIAHTTAKQRKERNGGMAVPVLLDARDHLDLRLPLDCCCEDELMTIHMHDIEGRGETGGTVLLDARDRLDLRLPLDCCCEDELMTIHMHDIEGALGMLPP
ncbi:unnamed protein product [Closterium sp. NIES-64]|nr:unnamed protein product [Closterium sp. NIES-64]